MDLSKTELKILAEIAQSNRSVSGIAKSLKKSKVQIYRAGKKLVQNQWIRLNNGFYEPSKIAFVNMLIQLLGEFPSLIDALSDSGISLLTTLLEPRSLPDISKRCHLGRTQVFKKLREARSISLVKHKNRKYSLNDKVWPKVIEFLQELKKHEEPIDSRVPANSIIYYKDDKEIIFSSKEEIAATPTAFSVFAKYGIKLLLRSHYYYLPKKTLTKVDVFKHALQIAEKEKDAKHIIFVALLYAKHRKELFNVKHPIMDCINKILEGEHIPGYPTMEEIKDRAEVYDIKI